MMTERKMNGGFVGSLLLLAAAILILFHTKPSNQTLQKLSSELAALRQEVGALAPLESGTADSAGRSLGGSLSEVEQKELRTQIPDKLEQHQLLLDLNRTAQQAGVVWNALSFTLDKKGALPAIDISGGFQGSAQGIARFLRNIELNPRKFVVKNAGVTRTEVIEGTPFATLSATFQSFYRYGE